eukprot:1140758-Pelagomonas_calceolata.AAC.5
MWATEVVPPTTERLPGSGGLSERKLFISSSGNSCRRRRNGGPCKRPAIPPCGYCHRMIFRTFMHSPSYNWIPQNAIRTLWRKIYRMHKESVMGLHSMHVAVRFGPVREPTCYLAVLGLTPFLGDQHTGIYVTYSSAFKLCAALRNSSTV